MTLVYEWFWYNPQEKLVTFLTVYVVDRWKTNQLLVDM